MSSHRKQVIDLVEQGVIPPQKISAALTAAKITPTGKDWQGFVKLLLLWLGGLAIAVSVMFFIAYNWDELGRFAKFGMVEALMILCITAYWKLGAETTSGKVSLLVATLFLGVLLALYGQTYQTGADPWQLFFNWALLMLPWAVISRFPAIWIVCLALFNLSIVLYYQTFQGVLWLIFASETDIIWLLFTFNTLALIVWESLTPFFHYLSEQWATRLLALASGITITWLVLFAIFETNSNQALSCLMWLGWLMSVYLVYRKLKPDLFMLAGGCLSAIVVIVTFMGKHLLDDGDASAFLLLAIVIIGLGTGAAIWLKNIHQELRL